MTNSFLSSGLFGGMFADPAIAAEFSAQAFMARMLDFETAWTEALAQCGMALPQDAQAGLAAIARMRAAPPLDTLGAGSTRDGLPVPALVKALRAGLDPGAAKAIHTGATSQDVIDSAMALTLLSALDLLGARLDEVLALLVGLEARFGDRPLMARTRMQAALPVTAALRLGAWRRALEGHGARLGPLRAQIGHAQIGGAVGLREAPQIAEAVAKTLGLALGPVWQTDRSAPVSMGHWLALLGGSLGKIGQDVALMAQQGVEEIALRASGGSSAMPHKQNPVRAEAMVALARYIASQQGALAHAMLHEQERSGTAWALEWLSLPAMAEACGAALNHALALFASVERIGAKG